MSIFGKHTAVAVNRKLRTVQIWRLVVTGFLSSRTFHLCQIVSPVLSRAGYPELSYLSDNPLPYYKKFPESMVVKLIKYQYLFIRTLIPSNRFYLLKFKGLNL